jgi:nitrite reductase (NO-forming)
MATHHGFELTSLTGIQGSRRGFVRRAAGLGLALPALGGLAIPPRTRAEGPATQGQHDGHSMTDSSGPPPAGFSLYDPALPSVAAGPKQIEIVARDASFPISHDAVFAGWTFDGTVPGRMLRAVEGDTIDFTFKVDPSAAIGHSLDFHSAKTAPNVNYRSIQPGEALRYRFAATYPGVYMYHCGTQPMLMHMGAGMVGAMIVDPKEGWSPAQELAFVQSEYYLTDDGTGTGTTTTDYAKMLGGGAADYCVFNGYANQYADNPIQVEVKAPVRVFVVNAGPNAWSSFHVVGTIFDRVLLNGNPKNELVGLQSVSIGPGDGAVVEFTLDEPGNYPFVNHSFGYASRGAVGVFLAS